MAPPLSGLLALFLGGAERVGVALAPVAEGPRRDAGEVLDVVGDHPGPARAEHLVEVLHGRGGRGRGTALDALPRELLGRDVVELDGAPEDVGEDLDAPPRRLPPQASAAWSAMAGSAVFAPTPNAAARASRAVRLASRNASEKGPAEGARE